MNKKETYINPNSIVNVTANDFEIHPYCEYHPKRIVKFCGIKIKVIPEHITDDFNSYAMDDMPNGLKVIDGVVYTKPHVWVNYFKAIPKVKYFETYEEALSHGRKIASEYHMVIDKFNNE